MERLSVRQTRRLALARAGLLKKGLTDMPGRATGHGSRARKAAERIIGRFGYLQLDTVSIAGARSHSIVLLSRLDGFEAQFGEELLTPGCGLFEYWGHEASWLPIEHYPTFAFRRREFRRHPWWGNIIGAHPELARDLEQRIRAEGPLRSIDMDGRGSRGWWDLKLTKRIATALWSSGDLAIRERRGFQRSYDLPERVIPISLLGRETSESDALETLVLRALAGHGWATISTIIATWRLTRYRAKVVEALERLEQQGLVTRAQLDLGNRRRIAGWLRVSDLELVSKLESIRPRRDRGVLLSPFDPVLWDRQRVALLFEFDQILEIFKPATQRRYGYYCLPVLAGEQLIARVDLKAARKEGLIHVLSIRYEGTDSPVPSSGRAQQATRSALERFSHALRLKLSN